VNFLDFFLLQIRELNQAVEVQITHWNPTGLVSRIEGIRAFLPVYHLFKQSSQASLHSLKDYVGRCMCVSITAFDEKTCNLIISEKQAWVSFLSLILGSLNVV
jgi:small subunit ribosomal protein S1